MANISTRKLKNKRLSSKKIQLSEVSEKQIEWLTEFLRDLGVGFIGGALLAGLIDELQWLIVILLLLIAMTLCYISYKFASNN